MTHPPSTLSSPSVAREVPSFSPCLEGYALSVQRFCAPWGSTDTQIMVGRRMLLDLAKMALLVELHPQGARSSECYDTPLPATS